MFVTAMAGAFALTSQLVTPAEFKGVEVTLSLPDGAVVTLPMPIAPDESKEEAVTVSVRVANLIYPDGKVVGVYLVPEEPR